MPRNPFPTLIPMTFTAATLTLSQAYGAPPFVAVAATCRVTLSQLSYDDTDGDDAELLVLRVERSTSDPRGGMGAPAPAPVPAPGPCVPPHVEGGAGSPGDPDGGSDLDAGPGPLQLGDCGLDRLDLVSGGSGACDVYRSIPLAEVPVPDDGYVVMCATDSTLAQAGACDVLAAGRSALKNGWLQNGPTDGLRFVAKDGSVTELAYEGSPACFASGPLVLPEESGRVDVNGTASDDVAVLCSGSYTLRPFTRDGLRLPNDCNTPSSVPGDGAAPRHETCTDGGCASGGAPSTSADAGRAPWVPELAPGVEPGFGPPSFSPGLSLDAGSYQPSASERGKVPEAPGCSLGGAIAPSPSSGGRGSLAFVAAAFVWVTSRRRR